MPTQTSARAHLQLQQGSNCTKSSLPTDLHIPVYDVNWKAAKSDSLIIASIVWSSAALSFVPCPEMTASYMSEGTTASHSGTERCHSCAAEHSVERQ